MTEEFFFRGFFYRAVRTRTAVWAAALIDGLVFGALHFQGADGAIILPVIAVFGLGCAPARRGRTAQAAMTIAPTTSAGTVSTASMATVLKAVPA